MSDENLGDNKYKEGYKEDANKILATPGALKFIPITQYENKKAFKSVLAERDDDFSNHSQETTVITKREFITEGDINGQKVPPKPDLTSGTDIEDPKVAGGLQLDASNSEIFHETSPVFSSHNSVELAPSISQKEIFPVVETIVSPATSESLLQNDAKLDLSSIKFTPNGDFAAPFCNLNGTNDVTILLNILDEEMESIDQNILCNSNRLTFSDKCKRWFQTSSKQMYFEKHPWAKYIQRDEYKDPLPNLEEINQLFND